MNGDGTLSDCMYSQKYCLNVKQATDYFGIGEKKLRKIIEDNIDSGMIIQNGSKYLIKREAFERWLTSITSI